MLGGFGAAIASQLMLVIGWAGWCIPALLFVWGGRFVLHMGNSRLLGRAIAIPAFAAFAAVFLATHVPPTGWSHGFGLGGLAGDAALGIIMDLVPLNLTFELIVVSLALGFAFLATALFALGFSKLELAYISRYSTVAIILTYASIVAFLGLIVKGGAKGAVAAKAGLDARREAKQEEQTVSTLRDMPEQPATGASPAETAQPTKPALTLPKFKIPSFRKPAEPEPQEDLVDLTADDGLDDEDRVRDRINDAIKSKVLRARTLRVPTRIEEPVVTENIFRELPDDDEPVAPALGGATRSYDDEVEAAPPQPTALQRPRPKPEPEPQSIIQHPKPKPAVKQSTKAQAEEQPSLFKGASTDYETPPLNLLANPANIVRHHLSDQALEENARMLESVLDDYGVKGDIVSVRPGPVVTMYELEPAPGLKASRVIGLADDIARSMSALSARVSTVPGRSVIGIELPNENRETVLLREILSSQDYGDGEQNLPLALGKDIGGKSVVANLAKMPHLLIAGTTGSG